MLLVAISVAFAFALIFLGERLARRPFL